LSQFVRQNLAGWGNFPVEPCHVYRPGKPSELAALLAERPERDFISRGLGRSYGDPAGNRDGGVILTPQWDRMLQLDSAAAILECEAGLSLATILKVLVPRGFFLPVTPGTKFVTVGGAIAADVHGKNHHRDGSFSQFVVDFTLLTAGGDVLTCSPQRNPDLFWATVGGMGLTGVILTARIQLLGIETAYLSVNYHRARDLDHALELFGQDDQRYRYSVAWVDCLAGGGKAAGKGLGRSVLMRGEHLSLAELTDWRKDRPLQPASKSYKSVPFFFPGFVLNPLTVKAFNKLFYSRHHDQRMVIDYDQYFYPLDSILHWNRIYGRRGFLQYQAVLPPEHSRAGLVQLLERLAAAQAASFLAVLKSMGAAGPGLLSFPVAGHTLTLDIPYTGPKVIELLGDLDRIVLDHGGRVYLAKDACMKPEIFVAM
jgi:decaprenylphospho-beta-D-ribofuranose 2-oxidase